MSIFEKPMIRFIFNWIVGSISAFMLGVILYFVDVALSSIKILWETKLGSWLLDVFHFWFFITLVGLPIGTIGGIILMNKVILKTSLNRMAIAIGIASSVFGLILVIWLLPAIGFDISRMMPNFEKMGYNVQIFLLPLTSGLFGTIGYEIATMISKTT